MQLLKDRIRKDGKIKEGNVLKVDSFLNHQMDVKLFQEIGKEFKRRFADEEITKILTIEASGIGIACVAAEVFDVPVVFAKKTQTKNIAGDVYTTKVESFTHGRVYDIIVSKEFLGKGDKVLLIDDFLANGKALEGLAELVTKSGAELVGAGVVIEKGFQVGGDIIRSKGIHLESLAIVESMDEKTGFDEATCMGVAKQVKQLVDDGVQVAIVTGGGNFWRGRTSETIDRVKADQIGMLATVMNCIYVSDIFRYAGMKTEVFTPFVCGAFTTLFSKDAAVEALNEGKVVFFAGGTGHPYFSTDTGAVLRAIEIEADAMLLAKAIDGIYDSDPKVNPEAKKYDEISIQEIIDKKLMAVDLTASIMCLENKMPMLVFGLNEENSIVETMKGTFTGTKVTV